MTIKNKSLSDLNDFLGKLSEAYTIDYGVMSDFVKEVNSTTNKENAAHLDWCLVHFHTSMVDLHKTIKNMQARLREIDGSN